MAPAPAPLQRYVAVAFCSCWRRNNPQSISTTNTCLHAEPDGTREERSVPTHENGQAPMFTAACRQRSTCVPSYLRLEACTARPAQSTNSTRPPAHALLPLHPVSSHPKAANQRQDPHTFSQLAPATLSISIICPGHRTFGYACMQRHPVLL